MKVKLMGQQRRNQKKSAAPTHRHPTITRVKSPANQEYELQGAIGNQEMGRLMETQRQNHPSSQKPNNPGELPLLGGMMPVSQGRIQRQPLFRGLSEEMRLENATLALPESGAAVQRKLTLGTVGDVYEQEADRVARHVVDEIHSSPFRASDTTSEGERIAEDGETGRVQRQITVRAAGDAGGELSGEWEGQLQRAKGGGQPLSPTVREQMGQAFGADFGGVRVHTGKQADMLARSIQAKAFTTGQDVFFRQGAYEPGSRGGQELLAHELTHVVQQTGHGRHPMIMAMNTNPSRIKKGKPGLKKTLVLDADKGSEKQVQRSNNIMYAPTLNNIMQFWIDYTPRPRWLAPFNTLAGFGQSWNHVIPYAAILNDLVICLNNWINARNLQQLNNPMGNAPNFQQLDNLTDRLFPTRPAPNYVNMTVARQQLQNDLIDGAGNIQTSARELLAQLNSSPDNVRAGNSLLNLAIGASLDPDFQSGLQDWEMHPGQNLIGNNLLDNPSGLNQVYLLTQQHNNMLWDYAQEFGWKNYHYGIAYCNITNIPTSSVQSPLLPIFQRTRFPTLIIPPGNPPLGSSFFRGGSGSVLVIR